MIRATLLACFVMVLAFILLAASAPKTKISNEEASVLAVVTQPTLPQPVDTMPLELEVEQPDGAQNVDTPEQEIVDDPPRHAEPAGRWVWARVTAYTAYDPIDSHSGYQDGYTSTMVNTQSSNPEHMYGIAADPRAVPYGTQVYVPGYWESLQRNRTSRPTEMTQVDDTGGALRRSWSREGIIHLDVRYRTRRAALNWGVRWMRVFIYE